VRFIRFFFAFRRAAPRRAASRPPPRRPNTPLTRPRRPRSAAEQALRRLCLEADASLKATAAAKLHSGACNSPKARLCCVQGAALAPAH
jgi:hypothetical protein